ncbi:phosphatidate cytidylyltransferase [Prochlorococcus marinus]|uniref:Phosphatidate cytidylyltransferase n=1 Tax=Prochlorococcus marinus (strain MIT 9211) TaxID=93059 RepID=A9BB20_PROM4|nr:phosphatidate cytidylyltransferase [Prochlorococcus marinus]ABX09032.1 Phosphatidate cytidylyltransferase [Prochlorococcus marinus str. MIT 9211]
MLSGLSRKRIISGFVAGMLGLLFVGLGGWWFTLSLCLIVHLALLEYFRMAEFTGIRPATKTTLVACQLLLLTTHFGIGEGFTSFISAGVLPLTGAAICGWLLLQPKTGSIADIAASIFGLFYLGFLPSHWIKLRNITHLDLTQSSPSLTHGLSGLFNIGFVMTFITCLMIVAFDIGSYVFGQIYGRRPLSPISPSKTIEGAIAGFLSAISIGAISGFILEWKMGVFIGAMLGMLVAFFALVGDLTESMMKRDAGLKDSGNVLPGHGGILDRIDSYLFTPAIVYYVIILIIPLIN